MDFLRCPHTQRELTAAPAALVEQLSKRRETLRNHDGETPAPFESGLLSGSPEDGWFYPIRTGIPILLPGEGIRLTMNG